MFFLLFIIVAIVIIVMAAKSSNKQRTVINTNTTTNFNSATPGAFTPAPTHGMTPGITSSSSGVNWGQVSAGERGVCFFCSRPMYLRELTPVNVNLNGRMQHVLACPDDLAMVQTGQLPPIRAFAVEGQYIPWYAYPSYDPFMDYYTYGFAANWMASRYQPTYFDAGYWGWDQPMGWNVNNNYVFTPDSETYQDYYSGQAAAYAAPPMDNVGGVDFQPGPPMNMGGMDFSGQQTGVGGVDFNQQPDRGGMNAAPQTGVGGMDFGTQPGVGGVDFGNNFNDNPAPASDFSSNNADYDQS